MQVLLDINKGKLKMSYNIVTLEHNRVERILTFGPTQVPGAVRFATIVENKLYLDTVDANSR